jgi:hypothetical protein
MDHRITELMSQIQQLETELEAEVARRAAGLRMAFENGRVEFEADVIRRHRELKTSLYQYLSTSHPLVILTAPLIYSLMIPLVITDVFISLYQYICFPLYGLKRVQRRDFFVFDRHHLAYLNLVEKINCAYCSYANGVIAYAMEVGSLTEARWCPIKHARRMQKAHSRYIDFVDYGDAEEYKHRQNHPAS